MKLPAGVVKKRNAYFARIHTKGGEKSYPLGSDTDAAVATFYQVKANVLAGRDPRVRLPEAPPAELTVADAAERWLRDKVDLELQNAPDIRSRAERSLLPFLGARPLHSLRRADCHAYVAHVRRENPHLMPATIGHYVRTLRELLNWCVDVELLDATPWPKGLLLPRVEKMAPDRLTDDEVKILVALPDPWGFNMRLALGTGCRWGELIALERTDLTPDGQLLIRRTKTGRFRTVPISRALLKEIMGRAGRLFVTREGKPYSTNSKGGFSATIARKSGIETFHPHRTRHTYACRFLEGGGAIVVLQQILGHSTLRMTEGYARPNERAIRRDAAAVYAAWDTPDREQNREHDEIPTFTASGG